jgi:hypothetical protein
MRRASWMGILLATVACGPPTLTVTMNQDSNSNQNGKATLTETAAGLTLVVDIAAHPTDTGAQPIHIHTGRCNNLGAIIYPMENLVAGKSTSALAGLELADLQGGQYAINAHHSTQGGVYVSCGDIP